MKFTLIALLFLFLLSCEKNSKDACESSDPANSVTWLVALKGTLSDCMCEMSIVRGSYYEEPVIFITMTDPACDAKPTPPTLYSCEGSLIDNRTPEDDEEFFANLEIEKVLYRCSEN